MNQEYIDEEYDNFIKPVRMASKLISIWPLEKGHTAMFFKNCHLIWLFFVVCIFEISSLMCDSTVTGINSP